MLIKPWMGKPVSSITPRDVRHLIGDIASRTPHGANAAWGHAALIFKYAVHEELIDVSPCASLDKKLVLLGAKFPPRQRLLTENEIAALWRASGELAHPEGSIYRWLLMSGCRLGEASGAQWSEFDIERGTWTVPAERFKSDQTNIVPLTGAMLALLASIPRNGPWVFSYDGKCPMNGFSKLKAKVNNLMGDVPAWVNHDLRRVVRTNLSALNVPDPVAEMVLGHGRRGLQRVYDRHRYLEQIRAALEAWNARLVVITGDKPKAPAGNIVPIKRRRLRA